MTVERFEQSSKDTHCPASQPKPHRHPSPSSTPRSTCCARSASRRCSAIPARPNCRSSPTGPTISTTCSGLQEASVDRHGRRLCAGHPQRRLRQSAFGRRRRQCARQYLHRASQPDPAGDHRGPAGALILPLQAFLYAERASEFPRPYVKYCVEPARAEDVPAAIARAYYVAMQPPCGPTFVSVPIDDWTHPAQPIEARQRQPRTRPRRRRDEGAGRGACREQAPCPRRRPRRRSRRGRRPDGAGRGEGQSRRSGSARFRRAAVSRNGIRNSRASCMPRRGSSPTRCAIMTWWS